MEKNFTIGAWYIMPDHNKLVLEGKAYFVEPLAMDVLSYFANNPHKVLSRDELVNNVWQGRIVGDHAVYRIINQIRKILSEDSKNIYIETIRKKGYQLSQKVSWDESNALAFESDFENETPTAVLTAGQSKETNRSRFSRKTLYLLTLLILLPVLWYGYKTAVRLIDYNHMKSFNLVKPFSVLIGEERDPSFSPDGNFISYSHRSEPSGFFKIYIQALAGESPIPVTISDGDDISSSWSPDGKQIAFIRHHENSCQIMKVTILPEVSRTAEKILDCHSTSLLTEILWAEDDSIYFTDSRSDVDPFRIYQYSLRTGKRSQLTNPDIGKSKGDIHMALSNQENTIAFARDLDWGNTQVRLLDLESREITNLFYLSGWRKALTWSSDDAYLYYIDKDDNIKVYSIEHGFHKMVLENSDTVNSVSSDKKTDRLAIMTGETGIDIWGVNFNNSSEEFTVIESSEIDLFPEFSHKSNDTIAFMSLRSGRSQIWIRQDTGKEYQLSHFVDDRDIQRIRWSPDDKFILSSSGNQLYVINVDSREYEIVWEYPESLRVEAPSWSLDGESIYFSSDLDGDWQIYKIGFRADTQPVPITQNGGYGAVESATGHLFFYKYHQDGIWGMSFETGEEIRLVEDTNVFAYDALYARSNGMFYISINDSNNLKFYDMSKRSSEIVIPMENPFVDVTISEDSSLVLFPKLFSRETEIKILEKQ